MAPGVWYETRCNADPLVILAYVSPMSGHAFQRRADDGRPHWSNGKHTVCYLVLPTYCEFSYHCGDVGQYFAGDRANHTQAEH